jgi:hypothetical protein
MKLKEFKQAMDWRRRVGFNGGGYVKKKVLPQPKPKEEAEKVNKARKEKTFEKAKGALENPKEVKEMIDKPKRGLVDEPGSYSQKSKKLGEQGFTGERGYTDAEAKKVFGKLLEGKKWSELSKKEKKNLGNTLDRRKKGQKVRTDYLPEDADDLKKIAKEYVDDIKKGFQNEDLSKIKLFNGYLEEKFPGRGISLEQAFRKRGVEKPSKQILYDAKQKLASKLVLKPNLTKQDIIKKLTSGNVQSFSDIVGIDVKKLPEYKFKRGVPGMGAQVQKDVEKLFKSKIITNKLNKNTLPTITDVSKVLKTDPTLSLARLLDLSDSIQDSKYSKILKDKADKFIESAPLKKSKNVVRRIYEKRFKSMLDLDTALPKLREDIVGKISNIIPQLKGLLNVDEVGSLTASMRRGSGPYAIFGQVLGSEFNQGVKGVKIDNVKSIAQRTINSLPIDSPERLEEIKKYNAKVDAFETEANKNNPIKKVKGQKISLKPPSETIKNKKVYNQYKDLFDDHYKKYGYSFEVSADTDSIPDIAKKLDNKAFQNTVKNRFTKLIGKGGKFGALVGLGTLAGTGFALADQPGVQEATSVLPTAAAAGTGAAAIGTKTGRSLLGKAFRTLGTPLSGLGFAATNVASKMKEGQSFADAVVDPLTGLELSFPGLFRENISKITRSPTLQKILGLGRVGRMLTPVGLGLAAAGQAQDFYNQYQNLQRMKRDDPEAYQQFRSTRVAPALSAAEQTAIEDMGRFGAAGGGIMKMAGKSSGPPPESGPTSQGLAFLIKRGR